MKRTLLVLLAFGLIACGKRTHVHYVETTQEPVVVDEVKEIVDQENEYRLSVGRPLLTKGLTCSVQQVSSGQKINSSSPVGGSNIVLTGTKFTYTYNGDFNQPEANPGDVNVLIPEQIRPIFVSINYYIRCDGFIVVTESGYYNFSLNSDDGSILTVNNTTVINNDGNHGMTLKQGGLNLRRGVVQFRLQYAQTGAGKFGLILLSNGSSIDSKHYYF